MGLDNLLGLASDEKLRQKLKLYKDKIEDLKTELETMEMTVKDVQDELDRRALKEQNFQIGDEVSVTQSLIDHKQRTVRQGHMYILNDTWKISAIQGDEAEIEHIEDEILEVSVWCPLSIAIEMRQAWLDRKEQ